MVPDIILGKNQILLTQGDSKLGIIIDNNNCIFGEVVSVNNLSNDISVGDFLLFNPLGAKNLLFDSELYYLIDTSQVVFKENV
jgi:hypothetical protein